MNTFMRRGEGEPYQFNIECIDFAVDTFVGATRLYLRNIYWDEREDNRRNLEPYQMFGHIVYTATNTRRTKKRIQQR